jgi:hypothetical protein
MYIAQAGWQHHQAVHVHRSVTIGAPDVGAREG